MLARALAIFAEAGRAIIGKRALFLQSTVNSNARMGVASLGSVRGVRCIPVANTLHHHRHHYTRGHHGQSRCRHDSKRACLDRAVSGSLPSLFDAPVPLFGSPIPSTPTITAYGSHRNYESFAQGIVQSPNICCMLPRGGGGQDMNYAHTYFSTDASTSTSSTITNTTTATLHETTNNENGNNPQKWHKAYLAVGSNMGNRYENIANSLSLLSKSNNNNNNNNNNSTATSNTIRILRTSQLRITSPMYVTDQPSFLNGAIEIETTLSPHELLRELKRVESEMGRDINGEGEGYVRFGPRVVDLDILLFHNGGDDGGGGDDDDDNDNNNTSLALGEGQVEDGASHGNPTNSSRTMVSSSSSLIMHTEDLEIPHPRMAEREFVLSPMADLENAAITTNNAILDTTAKDATISSNNNNNNNNNCQIIHPILNQSMSELLSSLQNGVLMSKSDNNDDSQEEQEEEEAVRMIPLPRNRMILFNETIIMGILNVTPDSFSDGGKYNSSNASTTSTTAMATALATGSSDDDDDAVVEAAFQAALQMEKDGAGIIDIGGESTRPGAEEVGLEEEMKRVVPVIQRIRQESDIPISIDTRNSIVAKAAIEAGADIVNDISGGTHDPKMLSCVASMGVPMIIMHMRGNPKTMQSASNTDYSNKNRSTGKRNGDDGVVSGVVSELMQRSLAAEAAGIPRWLQIVDPGIGFAKNAQGNLSLLKGVDALRQSCGNLPFLFGPSRKGFIGKITGEEDPAKRDFGTIAACLAVIRQRSSNDNDVQGGDAICNILRVHNVKAIKQAVTVYEAIINAK